VKKNSVKDKGKNWSVHEVAGYTKTHIKYNILISGKPFVLDVLDIVGVNVCGVKMWNITV
jgi:hypothetical protein